MYFGYYTNKSHYLCDKRLLLKNKILLFSEKWVRYGSPNCV